MTTDHLARAWGRTLPTWALGLIGDVAAHPLPERRSTIVAQARRPAADLPTRPADAMTAATPAQPTAEPRTFVRNGRSTIFRPLAGVATRLLLTSTTLLFVELMLIRWIPRKSATSASSATSC